MPIGDFTYFEFADGGIAHRVYRKGSGPAVVLMHEAPGMASATIALGEEIASHGFTVFMPLFFGRPGENRLLFNSLRLCVSREFHVFAARGGSPIVNWLRALCRAAWAECSGPGVGVIGMCLTGNFAIALMADGSVLAPVASQPSLPVAFTSRGHAALGVTDSELAAAKSRCAAGVPLLCLRFSNDRSIPRERFEALRAAFGAGFRGIEIDSAPGNAHDLPPKAHSVLTLDFVDREGHPTRQARDRVLGFLAEQLLGTPRDGAPRTAAATPA